MSLNIFLDGITEEFSGKEFTAKDIIEFVSTNKGIIKNEKKEIKSRFNDNVITKTNESQGHGKSWEIDIQNKIYDIENPKEIYKGNAKYDIPFVDNKLHNKNVSIKTSGSMSIDMADIRHLLNSENLDVVCVIYEQKKDIKEAIKTIVFDFDEFKKILIEDLKNCNYTLEEWVKLIHKYVIYVKSLPKDYYFKSKNIPQKEREHLIKKKPLCEGLKYFNIAPKIDSSQQRVQYTINLDKMNIKKTITDGGLLFGKEYTKTMISSSRIRKIKNFSESHLCPL
tara:strand:- start:288 stop:1130 length:843 start_codon:yes stop_codon:yes gene_type:complete